MGTISNLTTFRARNLEQVIDVRKDYKDTCEELNTLYLEFSESTKTKRLAVLRFLEYAAAFADPLSGSKENMNKSLFDYAEVCGFYQKMQNKRIISTCFNNMGCL